MTAIFKRGLLGNAVTNGTLCFYICLVRNFFVMAVIGDKLLEVLLDEQVLKLSTENLKTLYFNTLLKCIQSNL